MIQMRQAHTSSRKLSFLLGGNDLIGKVKISKTQTILLCFLVIAGGEILFIPTSLVEYAEQDSWISCLLGVGAGIVFIFFIPLFHVVFPKNRWQK